MQNNNLKMDQGISCDYTGLESISLRYLNTNLIGVL